MKAKREQIDGELMVIKLFAINYARDILYNRMKLTSSSSTMPFKSK
jgi:hypothetical protein